MATHYYYKEVTDPDDSSIKTPVRIDTLFQTKFNLSTAVPEDKETGYVELDRDISNLFELAEERKGLPSSASIDSDFTYYYVKGAPQDSPIPLGVQSVSRERKFIREYRYYNTYWTPANILFDVPPEYRDRWMFFIVSGFNSTHRSMNESSLCGGFIPPGTSQMNAGNTPVGTTHSGLHLSLKIYFCEVEIDPISRPDAPEGMVDLAEFFASDHLIWSYTGPHWWVPYVYMKYATNLHNGDGYVKAKNLPRGSFHWIGIGCENDDAWHTPQKIASGNKGLNVTDISFNKPNDRWWVAWFALEQYRQEWYG